MTQKEKIDYLINAYAHNTYTTDAFCDMFVCTLYYEKDSTISPELFSVLDTYAENFSRFSTHEDGVEEGFLFNEVRIKNVFNELMSFWDMRN